MTARRHRVGTGGVAVALGALAAVAGCAMDAADDDNPDGSVVVNCDMEISFSPSMPEAPAQILVDGTISRDEGLVGVEEYQFGVSFGMVEVEVEERDPYDGSKIEFTAGLPGAYRVSLTGGVGYTTCSTAVEIINVLDPGAATENYRLRFVPAAGQPAPMQEQVFSLPGGVTDYSLGVLGLGNGISASGSVIDGGAAPLPGYLRVTLDGATDPVVETFADATGSFSARLAAGTYQVLVVPADATVAPARFDGLAAAGMSLLTVTAGDPIAGVVVDGGGAPIVGARVSLRIDGVPSTIAVTDGDGGFLVRGRAGGATAVTVSPPPGRGLPRLDLPATAGLVAAPATPLTIQYAAALTARDLDLAVRDRDGTTPASEARVTWIARPMAAVGTVTSQGGDPLAAAGGLRLTGVADSGGNLAAVGLPEAFYDVLIETATGAVGLVEVDLGVGAASPTLLAAPASGTLSGTVDGEGSPVAAVSVTAAPRGLLANVAGASAMARSDGDGGFSLDLVGGGLYDLALVPAGADLARARRAAVAAPAAGTAGDLGVTELTAAIAVAGQVTIPGVAGGAAGVTVMALCYDCDGVAAQTPVAEAVTDASGRFTLALPDPGGGALR